MRLLGIALVFLVLCLPVLQNITLWAPDFHIDENRTAAPWPRVSPLRDPTAYAAGAERWFDDRFGLRDLLIRLKTQIDYSVFATSTRVHVGTDGWLFYRSVLDAEKPAIERLMPAAAPGMTAGIASLTSALRARDVRLVLMPVFLGDVFYPDRLPGDIPRLPQPSAFRLATQQWRGLPGLTYIDSEAVLRTIQPERVVFYRTDFHWNEPAAFEVARKLVDTLAALRGDPAAVWDHRLQIARRFYIGKESDFLPLFVQPSEQGLFVEHTWPDTVTIDRTQPGFEFVSTQTAPTQHTLPALCVVGDSFFDGLYESGVMSFFTHVYRARWASPATLGDALSRLPADCRTLLVEFIETQSWAFTALPDAARHLSPPSASAR